MNKYFFNKSLIIENNMNAGVGSASRKGRASGAGGVEAIIKLKNIIINLKMLLLLPIATIHNNFLQGGRSP